MTRADFYVGRGPNAEWIGSIAMDGYPGGIPRTVKRARSAVSFRRAVAALLAERDDATTPDMGWPWPWDDSGTTDYAYAYDEGRVWASGFGSPWFKPEGNEPEGTSGRKVPFPNMSARKAVTYGKRSGLLVVTIPRGVR